jgi:seryl-tRNA synthetase
MILVTLIMLLELLDRKQSTPAYKTQEIVSKLQGVVEAGEREIKDLEAKLARDQQAMRELAAVDADEVRRQASDLERLAASLKQELSELRREESKAEKRVDEANKRLEQSASEKVELDQLLEKIRRAQAEVAELRKRNRVIYNVAADASKAAWLVEIAGDRLLAAPVGKSSKPIVFAGSEQQRVADFLRWAAQRDRGGEYFMLLLKPSGISLFTGLRQGLKNAGFSMGFDLLAADQTAIDPEKGAAPP